MYAGEEGEALDTTPAAPASREPAGGGAPGRAGAAGEPSPRGSAARGPPVRSRLTPPAPSPPQPPRPREDGAVSSKLLLGQRPKTGSSYPLPPPPRAFPSCYFLGTQIGFYEKRRAESGSRPSRPFLPQLKRDMVLYARLTWRPGEEETPAAPCGFLQPGPAFPPACGAPAPRPRPSLGRILGCPGPPSTPRRQAAAAPAATGPLGSPRPFS